MKVEELLKKYYQWLPDEPHLGMIRHSILHGWAYIEFDEEDGIPFLVNNHGGRMPLQDVRWEPSIGGSESISANDNVGDKYGTICDTVDILINQYSQMESNKTRKYICDIRDMLFRMKNRENETITYLTEIVEIMNTINGKKPFCTTRFDDAVSEFENNMVDKFSKIDNIKCLGEDIKKEATNLEENLRQYMKIAVKIGTLYKKIKGNRNWDEELMKKQGII